MNSWRLTCLNPISGVGELRSQSAHRSSGNCTVSKTLMSLSSDCTVLPHSCPPSLVSIGNCAQRAGVCHGVATAGATQEMFDNMAPHHCKHPQRRIPRGSGAHARMRRHSCVWACMCALSYGFARRYSNARQRALHTLERSGSTMLSKTFFSLHGSARPCCSPPSPPCSSAP